MSELCVDANLVVKLPLKGEPFRNRARALVRDCIAAGITLIAPPVFESELDSVIRKRVFDRKLNLAEAHRALAVLDAIPVQTRTHPRLRQRAREIAEQFNQPRVYDATYAALAELRGCEFWTADKQFYEAVKDTLTFVKLLDGYAGLTP